MRDLWALSKQIDGLGGEWGFDVFVRRAWNFHFSPQWLYEPLRGFDDAWLSVWMRQKAAHMGVQDDAVGGTSVSFDYWASMLNSEDGIVPMPAPNDRYMGTHSVQLVGAPEREALTFFTAWSGWAKGDGLGTLSREYLDAYATSYMADRAWNVGPLGETTERLFRTDDATEFRELWMKPRAAYVSRLNGPLTLHLYEGWSYGYACSVDLLEITFKRNKRTSVRVAWCLLHHHFGKYRTTSRPQISEIVDLFVWPPFRRQHYGRLLEKLAAKQARSRGAEALHAAVWRADCVKAESEHAAIAFLGNRRYAVTPASGRQRAFEGVRTLA